jgi:CheY-like chemotaxis protein
LDAEILLRELRRLSAQLGTKRLLLVDDNDVARYILRELLNQPWLRFKKPEAEQRRLPESITREQNV